MTLAGRTPEKVKRFALPVSYKVGEKRERLRDAQNVMCFQGRLDTHFGYSRYNATSLGGQILSGSYYQKDDGTDYVLAKVGGTIYSVGSDSTLNPHATLITGLGATSKHRGITFNGRHIITVEGESRMYAFDGTTFSFLGQAAPELQDAEIIEIDATGTFPNATQYQFKMTYYSSTTGFESNPSEASEIYTTVSANKKIAIRLPSFTSEAVATDFNASNLFCDKIRIYLRNVTASGSYLFLGEITPPVASDQQTQDYVFADPPTNTTTPPEDDHAPPAGAKFITVFGDQIARAGDPDFPSEVTLSEPDDEDSFDDDLDAVVLTIKGNGPITGMVTGKYKGSDQPIPYLAIFKRNWIEVYTVAGGQVVISEEIGCVSHDTIVVRDGDIHFMSDLGFRTISNAELVSNKDKTDTTLGGGDIDRIFSDKSFEYAIGQNRITDSFSAYYPDLDYYMTWVSEGTSNSFAKTWVYEFEHKGFKPWKFTLPATCAFSAVDRNGKKCILFGDANGYLYQHSLNEKKSHVNASNTEVAIDAWAQIYWMPSNGDYAINYDYRDLIIEAMYNTSNVEVTAWVNFRFNIENSFNMSYADPSGSFILGTSVLDVGKLGDSSGYGRFEKDLTMVGESLLLKIRQNLIGKNLGLISAQLEYSPNGNRNVH